MLFDLLGVKEETRFGGQFWHEQVVAGLPALSLHRLAKVLDVSPADVAELAEVPDELAAWAARGQRLGLASSNAVYRLAIAFQRTMLVFKDEAEAAQWLRNPQKELGGNTPIRMLTSQPGNEEVVACLEKLKAAKKPKVEFSREELEAVSSIRLDGEDSELEGGADGADEPLSELED